MTVVAKADLIDNIEDEINDNTAGEISANDVRHNMVDIVDSIPSIAISNKPWKDALADSLSLKAKGARIVDDNTENTVNFSTACDLTDYLYLNIQLNHDRDLASVISPHIHWFQAENHIPNFLIQYRWQTLGGAKTTSWTSLKCNTSKLDYTSGTIHQICECTDIASPMGSLISDIIQFRIIRDNANGSTLFTGLDPYTATVGVLAFDVHFQIDSWGSTTEYQK